MPSVNLNAVPAIASQFGMPNWESLSPHGAPIRELSKIAIFDRFLKGFVEALFCCSEYFLVLPGLKFRFAKDFQYFEHILKRNAFKSDISSPVS